uniref:Protein phosphatase 1 regulatory subunit 35 C-terminal domain-containing protein n=1 Tax=Pygocentrus nattereri TaxID=42514 RepID=A0AAR2IMU2_PYGNA
RPKTPQRLGLRSVITPPQRGEPRRRPAAARPAERYNGSTLNGAPLLLRLRWTGAFGPGAGSDQIRPDQVRFDVSPDSCAKPPGPHRGHLAEQHAVTTSAPQPCSSQSAAEKPQGRRGHFPSHLSAQTDGQLEEGAELNTTLALRAELQQLKEAEFDSQKAVQEKLQNSVVTQEYIRVKAAEGLNFPRSQPLYRALVSVSLSHDQIINEVLRDRPALAPPTTSYKSRPRPAEGPDLMTFYSPQQLFRETPLLPGDQIPLPRPRPEPRPAHATFHLHQRHRQWEA